MTRPSGIDRLTANGPPNGDYARYVQQLSNAAGTTRPQPLPALPPLRPTVAVAAKVAPPVMPGPAHVRPAPSYIARPTTTIDDADGADEDDDDDEADADDDNAPLTDAQIAELRRALTQESSNTGGAGIRTLGRALTAVGIGLILYVMFGNGGAFSIFFAFVSFYIGGKLRSAAD